MSFPVIDVPFEEIKAPPQSWSAAPPGGELAVYESKPLPPTSSSPATPPGSSRNAPSMKSPPPSSKIPPRGIKPPVGSAPVSAPKLNVGLAFVDAVLFGLKTGWDLGGLLLDKVFNQPQDLLTDEDELNAIKNAPKHMDAPRNVQEVEYPFFGGQTPEANYTVSMAWDVLRIDTGTKTPDTKTLNNVKGAIVGLYQRYTGSFGWELRLVSRSGQADNLQDATGGPSYKQVNYRITNIVRTDGTPDTGGNPPATKPEIKYTTNNYYNPKNFYDNDFEGDNYTFNTTNNYNTTNNNYSNNTKNTPFPTPKLPPGSKPKQPSSNNRNTEPGTKPKPSEDKPPSDFKSPPYLLPPTSDDFTRNDTGKPGIKPPLVIPIDGVDVAPTPYLPPSVIPPELPETLTENDIEEGGEPPVEVDPCEVDPCFASIKNKIKELKDLLSVNVSGKFAGKQECEAELPIEHNYSSTGITGISLAFGALNERLKDLEKLICSKECEPAAEPMTWEFDRLRFRPQLIINLKENPSQVPQGQRPVYTRLIVPHPNISQDYPLSFVLFRGIYRCTATFPDNSRIILYADSKQNGFELLDYLCSLTTFGLNHSKKVSEVESVSRQYENRPISMGYKSAPEKFPEFDWYVKFDNPF